LNGAAVRGILPSARGGPGRPDLSLFVPDGYAPALAELSPAWLDSRGVRGLLLDLDDTLVPAYGEGLDPAAAAWVRACRDLRGVVVVSNNRNRDRVASVATELGVPYVHLALKPLPTGLRAGASLLGLPAREVAIVGDQIFTDVLGGRLLGMHTVLVGALSGAPRHPARRLVRALEAKILAGASLPNVTAGGVS